MVSLLKKRPVPAKFSVGAMIFYYEGLSIRQISETLGLTETAVKTRLSRGRQKLRILLKEE